MVLEQKNTVSQIVIKRFVFDASSIVALRAKYSTDNDSIPNPRPTRAVALSAFIWSGYLATIQPEQDPNKIYAVFHAANLRKRLDPPLSDQYFGNMSLSTASVASWDSEIGFDGIIIPARDTLLKVDDNYVKELQENGKQTKFLKENMEKLKKGEGATLAFTSLCRFPVYEADFGWGKAVWVGSAKLFNKNLVTFLDTKSGIGIESWIHLEEEEMAKFEVDKESYW